MRTKKRTLVTNKVYGFNPWTDQFLAINQMMEATGQKSEAPILRDLIDEALASRRRKEAVKESSDQAPSGQEMSEMLRTIQTLLLRMIGQDESSFRIQSLSLEILQETLAETRSSRLALWCNLIAPSLSESGKTPDEINRLFEALTDNGKDFAYGLTGEIRDQLDVTETESQSRTVEEYDRQGKLTYDGAPSTDIARVS